MLCRQREHSELRHRYANQRSGSLHYVKGPSLRAPVSLPTVDSCLESHSAAPQRTALSGKVFTVAMSFLPEGILEQFEKVQT